MSYIDTFDHEVMGFFDGLPLYHPLEIVKGSGPLSDEFGCTPDNLVLGGGSGEHPAIVIDSLPNAVLYFLRFSARKANLSLTQEQMDVFDALPPYRSLLRFAGWTWKDFDGFYQSCLSKAFVTPFNPEDHENIEEWLICSIGEFVWFALPDLIPSIPIAIKDAHEMARSALFLNVLIAPPGVPIQAGRRRDNQGSVIWGNYAWIAERKETTL